jgi:hypothetical protein
LFFLSRLKFILRRTVCNEIVCSERERYNSSN